MSVKHFKEKLLAKRNELMDAIGHAKQEGRIVSEVDVRDSGDLAVEDAAADEALQLRTADSETLKQVEDALSRIEAGSYGKCVPCGKTIEPARLEAIPWTRYCLADQEKLEKQKGPAATPTL